MRLGSWQARTLVILGLGYMIGKDLSVLVVGPRFLRWYLADICFVPCFASTPILFDSMRGKFGFGTLKKAALLALIFFIAAMMQEILLINAQRGKPSKLATGDWNDVWCYMFMFLFTMWLIKSLADSFLKKQEAGEIIEAERDRYLARIPKPTEKKKKNRRWRPPTPRIIKVRSKTYERK